MEGGPVYRWEQGINATWDAVQEDEQGNLIGVVGSDKERLHRNRQQKRLSQSIRRGIIRYLVVALDCSAASLETDYRPSRLEATSSAVQKFVVDYYDQNPISQLAIILSRDRTAEKCSDLSGNARSHVDHLRRVHHAHDLASLESCILLALKLLRHIPNYGHRELLIVYNSLSSCDAGDIYLTIQKAKQAKLRISVISTLAEIFICRQIAELTGGTFNVAMDAAHLTELLQKHTSPPADLMQSASEAHKTRQTEFIRMGFPRLSFSDHRLLGYEGKHLGRFAVGYHCPRCYTRASDIPTKCAVCQLQLNSSSHIARSFHHLFPVPSFYEYQVKVMPRLAFQSKFLGVQAKEEEIQDGIMVKLEPDKWNELNEKIRKIVNSFTTEEVFVAQRTVVDLESYYTDGEEEEDDGEDGHTQTKTDGNHEEAFKSNKRRRLSQHSNEQKDNFVCEQIVLCDAATLKRNAVSVSSKVLHTDSSKQIQISMRSNQCFGCSELLHPVPKSSELSVSTAISSSSSAKAADSLVGTTEKIIFQCPRCSHLFCIDCDIFVHDVLHNCPGCPF